MVSEGGEASIQAASEELVLGLSGLTGNTVMAGTAVSAAGTS